MPIIISTNGDRADQGSATTVAAARVDAAFAMISSGDVTWAMIMARI